MKKLISLVLLVLMSLSLFAYNTSNYREIGGSKWVIGGELDIVGGSLEIEGTAISATADEINLSDLSLQTTEITTAGAIDVTKRNATINSTGGAFAVTLAAPDASMVGSLLMITLTVDGGDVTLGLGEVVGGSAATTATFADAGDTLTLIGGASSKWVVIDEHGVTLS